MSVEPNMTKSTAIGAFVNKFCTVFFRYCLILIILGNGVKIEGFSSNNSDFTVFKAFKYPKTRLRHYEWRYFRVELPSGFSTVSLELTTDWENRDVIGLSNNTAPLVCFRSGGPPLPGSTVESDLIAAISVGHIRNISNMGQCAVFLKSMSMNLTSEQHIWQEENLADLQRKQNMDNIQLNLKMNVILQYAPTHTGFFWSSLLWVFQWCWTYAYSIKDDLSRLSLYFWS